MKSPDITQVRVPPADASPELIAALEKVVEDLPEVAPSWRYRLAQVIHPLGIHHWVTYNTFDPGSNRIIKHPGKWVCTECPKGRLM